MKNNREKEWQEYIEKIKSYGAGEYGSAFFCARKDEHWKFLWAYEYIKELEEKLKHQTMLAETRYKDMVYLNDQLKLRGVDVLADRRKALDELTKLGQEMGDYDL